MTLISRITESLQGINPYQTACNYISVALGTFGLYKGLHAVPSFVQDPNSLTEPAIYITEGILILATAVAASFFGRGFGLPSSSISNKNLEKLIKSTTGNNNKLKTLEDLDTKREVSNIIMRSGLHSEPYNTKVTEGTNLAVLLSYKKNNYLVAAYGNITEIIVVQLRDVAKKEITLNLKNVFVISKSDGVMKKQIQQNHQVDYKKFIYFSNFNNLKKTMRWVLKSFYEKKDRLDKYEQLDSFIQGIIKKE